MKAPVLCEAGGAAAAHRWGAKRARSLTRCPALFAQEDPLLTRTWNKTVRVAVTGAAGQISNHLLFMVRRRLRGGGGARATAREPQRARTKRAVARTGGAV